MTQLPNDLWSYAPALFALVLFIFMSFVTQ